MQTKNNLKNGASKSASKSTLNLPNALTLLRLVLVPFFAYALVLSFISSEHSFSYKVVSFCIFSAAMLTDKLDGYIARKYNLITNVGKILDPIADKSIISAGLIVLSLYSQISWVVTLIILAREIGITIYRMYLIKYKSIVLPASSGGKLKTVSQVVAVALYCLPLENMPAFISVAAYIILIFATAVTVITGIQYVTSVNKSAQNNTNSKQNNTNSKQDSAE
jgi:CDP-diacylglycerol--glycerol-3-phosphate 3-phosphatidyltransferase